MRGTKVIILGKKKEKKILARPGFELMTFTSEGKRADHYTMDP
jgi:hypothetical protein